MKEHEQPSSTRTGRTDESPARIPLYCFRCRYTFEATIPARDGPVNRKAENSGGKSRALLPPCPLCRRRTQLYRLHRL